MNINKKRIMNRFVIKSSIGILLAVILTSCMSTLPLKQHFYNNQKVGVIVQVDNISVGREGAQGLLDIVITPGNRFKEPLQNIEPEFKLKEKIETEISTILEAKNKKYEIIKENFDYAKLNNFEKPGSGKKDSKKDFRNFKTSHNLDEIFFVKVKYGLLISYYGMIEIGKQGYANFTTELIDLNDNSLLQRENILKPAEIKGNWKDGENYSNLSNSIQKAIDNSTARLKDIFNLKQHPRNDESQHHLQF